MPKKDSETKAKTSKSKKAETVETPVEKDLVQDTTPVVTEAETKDTPEKKLAKAGKRSAKAIAEEEALQAKEERKAQKAESDAAEAEKPKILGKPTRPRSERRGKKFKKAAEGIDPKNLYQTKEAVELAIKSSPVKFDATVEVHVRLGVDPRQADQNLRDNIVLPAGTGKTVRIAVFAEDDVAKEAVKAGADIAGNEDFLKILDKGVIEFDVLIATPNMMAKLSKYARILGPKGLMPNPKSGTVTNDVAKAVTASKAGKVEYRVDSTGIVHLGIGKVSFGTDKILQNLNVVFASLRSNKPSTIKGTYVKSITLTTSMGPAVKVNPSEL